MVFAMRFAPKLSMAHFRQSYEYMYNCTNRATPLAMRTIVRPMLSKKNKTVGSPHASATHAPATHATITSIPDNQHVVYPNSIEWIATRIVRELPPDVRQQLTIVSIGCGSGQNDVALAHCLTHGHGCKVQTYVLVDPVEHPASATFYPQIKAEKVIKSRSTADVFVANLTCYFSVTVLSNSLMHIGDDDPDAIHRFMQGSPFGRHCSPLTFITGNPNASTIYGPDGFMTKVGKMPSVVKSDTMSFESEVVHEEFVCVVSNRDNREVVSSDSYVACFLLHRKDVIKPPTE